MNLEHYTQKSREAVDRAQRIAREHGHQELRPEHLLAALLAEEGGTVQAVLAKLGVARPALVAHAEEALRALPRVQGGTLWLGEALRSVFERAEAESERLKDEFTSVEHLLFALADAAHPGGAQRALARAGVTQEALFKAVPVALRRSSNGLSFKLTDASQRKVDRLMEQCRDKHGSAHYRKGVLPDKTASIGVFYTTHTEPLT